MAKPKPKGFRNVQRSIARRAGRARQVDAARRAGTASGVASVFRISGRDGPAPPTVRRESGSVEEDARAIKRDGERLFGGGRK